ncbi:hypothetical protein MKW98_017434, partial [Papaver atlanticum]
DNELKQGGEAINCTSHARAGKLEKQVKKLKKEIETQSAKRRVHLKHLFPKSIYFRIYAHMLLAIENEKKTSDCIRLRVVLGSAHWLPGKDKEKNNFWTGFCCFFS